MAAVLESDRILSPTSFRKFARSSAFALMLASSTLGCVGEGEGTGELVVNFQLGNAKTCEELGVVTINVRVAAERQVKQLCTAGTQVRFADLPTGIYDVQVEALDAKEVVIMNNGAAADRFSAEVLPNHSTETTAINLTNVPAHLYIRWIFDGGFGNCTTSGISKFEIDAWDTTGSERLLLSEVGCDLNGDEEFYRTVDDPERKIDGRRFGEVSVQPLGVNNQPFGSPARFKLAQPPGAGYFVKLTVTCTGGVNSGPNSGAGCTAGDALVLP